MVRAALIIYGSVEENGSHQREWVDEMGDGHIAIDKDWRTTAVGYYITLMSRIEFWLG